MLLTLTSSPSNSSSLGRPNFLHSSGPQTRPRSEDVWNSFCESEDEEKHNRTLTLSLLSRRTVAERRRRDATSEVSVGEAAQKHVTRMISRVADSIAGRMFEV